MMRSNEVSTEEFTECTSTGWQPHLQDESSNALVNSENLLHSSVRQTIYNVIAIIISLLRAKKVVRMYYYIYLFRLILLHIQRNELAPA